MQAQEIERAEEGDERLQALMLYAAVLRQQADEFVSSCCDAAEEEFTDFTAAQQLFLRAAGIYSWILDNLLSSKDASEGK